MKMKTLVEIIMIVGVLLIFGSITAFAWKISPGVAVLVAGIILAGAGCAIYDVIEE